MLYRWLLIVALVGFALGATTSSIGSSKRSSSSSKATLSVFQLSRQSMASSSQAPSRIFSTTKMSSVQSTSTKVSALSSQPASTSIKISSIIKSSFSTKALTRTSTKTPLAVFSLTRPISSTSLIQSSQKTASSKSSLVSQPSAKPTQFSQITSRSILSSTTQQSCVPVTVTVSPSSSLRNSLSLRLSTVTLQALTVTVTASTSPLKCSASSGLPMATLPASTVTVTASATSLKCSASSSISIVTLQASTVTITASASSMKCSASSGLSLATLPAATITVTASAPALNCSASSSISVVTLQASTITVTATQSSSICQITTVVTGDPIQSLSSQVSSTLISLSSISTVTSFVTLSTPASSPSVSIAVSSISIVTSFVTLNASASACPSALPPATASSSVQPLNSSAISSGRPWPSLACLTTTSFYATVPGVYSAFTTSNSVIFRLMCPAQSTVPDSSIMTSSAQSASQTYTPATCPSHSTVSAVTVTVWSTSSIATNGNPGTVSSNPTFSSSITTPTLTSPQLTSFINGIVTTSTSLTVLQSQLSSVTSSTTLSTTSSAVSCQGSGSVIVNGGFEDHGLEQDPLKFITPWRWLPEVWVAGSSSPFPSSYMSHSGMYNLMNYHGAADGSIQILQTVQVCPYTSYNFEFFSETDVGQNGQTTNFTVCFGDDCSIVGTVAQSQPWTRYTRLYNGGRDTQLNVSISTGPSYLFIRLDDVSFTPISSSSPPSVMLSSASVSQLVSSTSLLPVPSTTPTISSTLVGRLSTYTSIATSILSSTSTSFSCATSTGSVLINGGFEENNNPPWGSDIHPWVLTAYSIIQPTIDKSNAYKGTSACFLDHNEHNPMNFSLSQIVKICPATNYEFSFWAETDTNLEIPCVINACFDEDCQYMASIYDYMGSYTRFSTVYQGNSKSTINLSIRSANCGNFIWLDEFSFAPTTLALINAPHATPNTVCSTEIGVDAIVNGGFENGLGLDQSPWSISGQGGLIGIGAPLPLAHSGDNSFLMYSPQPYTAVSWSLQQPVSVCANTAMTFNFWAANYESWSDDVHSTCQIFVCFGSDCALAATLPYNGVASVSGYALYSRTFAGLSYASTFNVSISTNNCVELVALDDISFVVSGTTGTSSTITPVSSSTMAIAAATSAVATSSPAVDICQNSDNLLRNSGFEDVTRPSWGWDNPNDIIPWIFTAPDSNMDSQIQSNIAYDLQLSGTYGLAIFWGSTSAPLSWTLSQTVSPICPDATYDFSFSAQAMNAGADCAIDACFNGQCTHIGTLTKTNMAATRYELGVAGIGESSVEVMIRSDDCEFVFAVDDFVFALY